MVSSRCSTLHVRLSHPSQQHHQILIPAESPTNDDGSLALQHVALCNFFTIFTLTLQSISALAFMPSFTFALEAFCASVHTFIILSSETIKTSHPATSVSRNKPFVRSSFYACQRNAAGAHSLCRTSTPAQAVQRACSPFASTVSFMHLLAATAGCSGQVCKYTQDDTRCRREHRGVRGLLLFCAAYACHCDDRSCCGLRCARGRAADVEWLVRVKWRVCVLFINV